MASSLSNPFQALDEYQNPTDLASSAAESNLAAAPQLEQLSQLVNQINQSANMVRQPDAGGAQSQLWQNLGQNAAGNLSGSFINNLQTNLAQQYGGRGFGVDSAAMNSAAQRAMGIESQQLQSQAVNDYAKLMAQLPELYDVSKSLVTPALAAQQRQAEVSDALRAYQLENSDPNSVWALAAAAGQRARGGTGGGISLGSDFGKFSEGPAGGGSGYDDLFSSLYGSVGSGGYDPYTTTGSGTGFWDTTGSGGSGFTDYGYSGPIA